MARRIERSIKTGGAIAWKPLKVIHSWIVKNPKLFNERIRSFVGTHRAKFTNASNKLVAAFAVYGTVLAVIETNCFLDCCGKEHYDGEILFDTRRAVDYYVGKIKFW